MKESAPFHCTLLKLRLPSVLMLAMLLFPACNELSSGDKHSGCGVDNPLEELSWLKDIATAIEVNMGMAGSEIIQYTYEGETVFWIDRCYGCADNMIEVYNCTGEVICQFGGIAGFNTCPDFEENASDKVVLLDNIQRN